MLRLLFLCLMLTLQGSADTFTSEQREGSADDLENDDDEYATREEPYTVKNLGAEIIDADKTTGETEANLGAKPIDADKTTGETEDGITIIVIVAAVSLVAISAAVIVAIVIIRRRMHNRQQGIYSVPAEQGLKGAV